MCFVLPYSRPFWLPSAGVSLFLFEAHHTTTTGLGRKTYLRAQIERLIRPRVREEYPRTPTAMRKKQGKTSL